MTARTFAALFFSLALPGAIAQTTPTPAPKPAAGDEAKPAVRETPPDQKAYNDAMRITEPEKKIEALQKVKKDFPDSVYAGVVDSAVFSTMVDKMPDQKDRILKTAKAMYAEAVSKDKAASKENVIVTTAARGNTANSIANQLLNGGILLKDAESYARKGVEAMRENVWIAERREALAKRKQKIPPQEELAKSFAEARAARLATLGRVELKLGKTREAQKLLEESYAVTQSNLAVTAALGELAVKAGDDTKAMDYLVAARLTGTRSGHRQPGFRDTL